MGLLNFLVKSNTRRDLLKLLWAEEIVASGHQLSLLLGAAYSATHVELEAMKEEGIVKAHKEGKAEVYSKNERYPHKHALLLLLAPFGRALDLSAVDDEGVKSNLAKYGTPVLSTKKPKRYLSLEEALAHGLDLARRDASVARSLPVAFAKNREKVDLARLEFLARKRNLLPVLGFYLDLTAQLLGDRKLQKTALGLLDRRRKRKELFFNTQKRISKFEQVLAENNTPPVARKWNFLMNLGMDSFEGIFRKNMKRQGYL